MKFVLKKTAGFIIALFIVSVLAFLAFEIIPGDPARALLGTEATEEKVEALRGGDGAEPLASREVWGVGERLCDGRYGNFLLLPGSGEGIDWGEDPHHSGYHRDVFSVYSFCSPSLWEFCVSIIGTGRRTGSFWS